MMSPTNKPPSRRPEDNDFNLPEVVKTVEDHAKGLEGLETRIKNLENRCSNNEVFAESFYEAAENINKVSEVMGKCFRKNIVNDAETIQVFNDFIKKSDRNYFYLFLKTVGWVIAMLGSGIIGALLNAHSHS